MPSRTDPFDYPIVQTTVCPPFRRRPRYDPTPTERLDLIPGRRQRLLEAAHVFMIGQGGQSIVAQGLLRSGAKQLTTCDPDFFEFSNFSRQLGYSTTDRGQPKAHRVARNLRREAVNGATIRSIALPFPEALAYLDSRPTVVSCLVDDNQCRLAAAEYAAREGLPIVIAGLSRDGLRAYAFLQRPGEACLRDAFPDLAPVRAPCVAACIKTVYLVGAYMLHFIDVALMGWGDDADPYNLVLADLNGRITGMRMVERRPDCPLCQAVSS